VKIEYGLLCDTFLFIDLHLMQFMIWTEVNCYMEMLYSYLEDPYLFTHVAYVLVT